MSKKVTIISLVILMTFLSLGQPIYSIDTINPNQQIVHAIQPRWINVNGASLILDVSENPITVGFDFGGYTGTTYSNGTLVLEKISGSHTGVIKTWTNLSSNSSLYSFDDEVETILTAGQYRVTLTITATRNGVSEEIELSKVSVR